MKTNGSMARTDNHLTISATARWGPIDMAGLEWVECFGRHALEIRSGGPCRFDVQTTNSPHSHTFYEICLVLAGSGRFHHGEAVHAVGEGDIFVADPGCVHEITSHETRDLFLIFFQFEVRALAGSGAERDADRLLGRFLERHAIVGRNRKDLWGWVPILNARMHNGPGAGWARREACKLIVLEMLASLVGSDAVGRGATGFGGPAACPAPEPVRRALDYIQSHVRGPVTVSAIAQFAGISERTLRRLFRRHVGHGVLDEVNHQRAIGAAHALLMRFRVHEVAASFGIESPAQFCRLFRRHFGMSPREYQEGHAPLQRAQATTFHPRMGLGASRDGGD